MYVFCGIHENAPLKSPAVGTIINQQPQLQCSRIHHCIFAEAMLLMDYSQLMTEQDRITKAGPFLKDARPLLTGNFGTRTPHWPR